jgi:hypothetical protein
LCAVSLQAGVSRVDAVAQDVHIFAVTFRADFNSRDDADACGETMAAVISRYRIVVGNSHDAEPGVDGHLC